MTCPSCGRELPGEFPFCPLGRRAEADEQLQQALDFYRSVGATQYVRECEALLAVSA